MKRFYFPIVGLLSNLFSTKLEESHMSGLLSDQLSGVWNFFVDVQIWVAALCSVASDFSRNDIKEAEARLIHLGVQLKVIQRIPARTEESGRERKPQLVVGVFVVFLPSTLFSRVWTRAEPHRKISNSHDIEPIINT